MTSVVNQTGMCGDSCGIDGRVTLAAPGFAPAEASFRLSPASAAFVKTFALRREASAAIFVAARPWGIASIAGSVQGRETPVAAAKVPAGTHLVQVRYPPTGQTVSARVRVGEGQVGRCQASFASSPAISCSVSGQ